MSKPPLSADALRKTFPACEDAPLALVLVRLLARGKPLTDAILAATEGRAIDEVAARLPRWPNMERDADDAVIEAWILELEAANGDAASRPTASASSRTSPSQPLK